MAKRFTATDKWDKIGFLKYKPKFKLALVYMWDRCDASGLFEPIIKRMSQDIGLHYNLDELRATFEPERIVSVEEKWFLRGFIEFQYGHLSQDCKPHQPVIARLLEFNILNSDYSLKEEYSKGYGKGIITLQDKEKDKDKEKEKDKGKDKEGEDSLLGDKARPKDGSQVQAYFAQIKCTPSRYHAEKWWDHYSRAEVNWRVKIGGKLVPMLDWKAACRHWKTNAEKFGDIKPEPPRLAKPVMFPEVKPLSVDVKAEVDETLNKLSSAWKMPDPERDKKIANDAEARERLRNSQ